jgi:branched-chain amino acid transport system ATP-binding protein
VQPGEIVALLGRNGSGRSTTAKAIMGLVDCQGSVQWKGQESAGQARPTKLPTSAWATCPKAATSFPNLTVHQNLLLGQKGSGKGSRWSFDDMYQMFPRLKERQHTEAGVLSAASSRC